VCVVALVDPLKLDIENQIRVGRNMSGKASVAISIVCSDVECRFFAKLHSGYSLVPALDDLTDANGGLERSSSNGGVKLCALVARLGGILQKASVLNGDLVSDVGGRSVTLLQNGLCDAHDGSCS